MATADCRGCGMEASAGSRFLAGVVRGWDWGWEFGPEAAVLAAVETVAEFRDREEDEELFWIFRRSKILEVSSEKDESFELEGDDDEDRMEDEEAGDSQSD